MSSPPPIIFFAPRRIVPIRAIIAPFLLQVFELRLAQLFFGEVKRLAAAKPLRIFHPGVSKAPQDEIAEDDDADRYAPDLQESATDLFSNRPMLIATPWE